MRLVGWTRNGKEILMDLPPLCSDWKLVGKPTDIDRERREWLAEARKIIKGEIPRNATRSELDSWRIGLEASLPGHPDIAKALTIVNRKLKNTAP